MQDKRKLCECNNRLMLKPSQMFVCKNFYLLIDLFDDTILNCKEKNVNKFSAINIFSDSFTKKLLTVQQISEVRKKNLAYRID